MYKLLFISVLLTASTMISAQDKTVKQVATAVEQLRKAMVDGDKQMLERLADDQLSYGHSGGHIDDKKEFVEKNCER